MPEKENARAGVKAYAPKVAGERVWVRINGIETGMAEADLDAVIGVKASPACSCPRSKRARRSSAGTSMISALEKARGLAHGATRLVLSIESARGVLNAYDMSLGAARVASLTFGGAQDGDLNTDLGCVWSIDGPEMMHARCHTLLCARAARFDTPLDGVFANVRDPEGFEKDTALSRRLGYRGRKLIHPSQIEPCNRLYAPSQKELDYYARVLEAFEKALAQGSASTTVDGKMIDVAMANAARRVLDEAAALKKAG